MWKEEEEEEIPTFSTCHFERRGFFSRRISLQKRESVHSRNGVGRNNKNWPCSNVLGRENNLNMPFIYQKFYFLEKDVDFWKKKKMLVQSKRN